MSNVAGQLGHECFGSLLGPISLEKFLSAVDVGKSTAAICCLLNDTIHWKTAGDSSMACEGREDRGRSEDRRDRSEWRRRSILESWNDTGAGDQEQEPRKEVMTAT